MRREEASTVIVLTGELDMSNAEQLSAAVSEELGNNPHRVVLDLSDLSFCDSRGLATLLMVSRAAGEQQTDLAVRNPSPFFTRMLDVTGVRSALNITT